jgi:hypothetical protein
MEARRRVRIGIGVALLLGLGAEGDLGAVDFIRGDANSDGVVSFADGEAVLGYLFRHEELPCLDAADATDSGGVDIVDAAAIRNHVINGAYDPPSPFPEPGPDPTPRPDDWPTGCNAYGEGAMVDDPQARIEILDAVAPGGGNGRVRLDLAISNSVPITAYYAALIVGADVVSGVSESAASYLPGIASGQRLSAGRLTVVSDHVSQSDTVVIPPGESVVAAELPLCLAMGTPAGEYAITVESGELVHAGTNRAITPTLASGTLRVLADVAVAEDCGDTAPPPINALYELVGGSATPGETVEVPLKMQADAVIQGFAYSVDFEEEVLEALGTDAIWQRPDGGEFGFAIHEINNENAIPGSAGVDEGFLVGAVIIDLEGPVGLPANVDHEVLRFRLRVRPETTAATTELRFIDGGQGTGQPVPNHVVANGDARYTRDSASSFLFISGLIGVMPDIVTFLRGDANGDETVDISDPQRTLNHLFLGSGQPACFDAADANDDGTLNIADAIFTLAYLFSSGSAPSPPFPAAGLDPTEDAMGCLRRGS